MPRQHSFPATRRILKSREFLKAKQEGRKLFSKHFLMLASVATGKVSRLGITITTKIDKRAAVRNKLKRRIRHIFRTHQDKFKSPVDLVVIARQDSPKCSFDEIKREILGLLRRTGYLIAADK